MYRQLAVAEGNESANQGAALQSGNGRYKNGGHNGSGQLLL